ncbi:MAG: 16S rRNA (uracil(1498)-N(3))-methyltransferase [Bdellovibrionota bacterium]
MNLILLEDIDFTSDSRVLLSGRRARHIFEIHRAKPDDFLRIGIVGGRLGTGRCLRIDETSCELEVAIETDPPPPLALTLYLALPRPKFLKRVLQTVSSLGVKDLHLVNSYRVEKVYWSCEQLEAHEIREALLLGLEQARDTILPRVHQHRLFKPFVEDELPALIRGHRALVAHPTAKATCPREISTAHTSLAVGPEGGFIDYEVEKLSAAGFTPVEIGPRILKVETAVTALIARLT